jgi:hypothetical protein
LEAAACILTVFDCRLGLINYIWTKDIPFSILYAMKWLKSRFDRCKVIFQAPNNLWNIIDVAELVEQKACTMQGRDCNADEACGNARRIRHFDVINVKRTKNSDAGSEIEVLCIYN